MLSQGPVHRECPRPTAKGFGQSSAHSIQDQSPTEQPDCFCSSQHVNSWPTWHWADRTPPPVASQFTFWMRTDGLSYQLVEGALKVVREMAELVSGSKQTLETSFCIRQDHYALWVVVSLAKLPLHFHSTSDFPKRLSLQIKGFLHL